MHPVNLSISVAWHGLPFYAAECLAALSASRAPGTVSVIATRDHGSIFGSQADESLKPIWINEALPCSFASLSLPVPELFFKTSWHHPAFEALAEEVRRSGGAVVILADNTFALRPRKLLGMLYARLKLVSTHWGVFVPGRAGCFFMRLLGFRRDRIYQKLYCTNTEKFSARSVKRHPTLLFVGRFEPEKNILNLIAGWKRYRRDGGRLQELHLVGRGSIKVETDYQAGIKVTDWSSQEELRNFMERAEVFILPSRRDHWGVVLLEAALCGCMLVATETCGAAHDLIDGNGVRFAGHSPRAIARALHAADLLALPSPTGAAAGDQSRKLGEGFSTGEFVASVMQIEREVAEHRSECRTKA